jgi:hypothetical protein
VPGQQPSDDCGFARRAKRWRQAVTSWISRLFHIRNGAAHLRPLNQKIMQRIIDLIDLAAEIFKRFTKFAHVRAICGRRHHFGSPAPSLGFIDKARTEKIKALRDDCL